MTITAFTIRNTDIQTNILNLIMDRNTEWSIIMEKSIMVGPKCRPPGAVKGYPQNIAIMDLRLIAPQGIKDSFFKNWISVSGALSEKPTSFKFANSCKKSRENVGGYFFRLYIMKKFQKLSYFSWDNVSKGGYSSADLFSLTNFIEPLTQGRATSKLFESAE